ncbi:MAG: transcriptional regulator [Clostridia bacterium]|nr:transcriptional regulator [Clostridia bacterium]
MQNRFETFTLLISRINRAIQKIKSEEMAEFHLKSSHVSCLYYLYKENSLTARDLCEICGEDKANISRSIKYLETNGYLVCESATAKRYLSALKLTEKGSTVGSHLSEKIDNILEEASIGLSDEDRKIMYRSLSVVSQNLLKICSEYREQEVGEND